MQARLSPEFSSWLQPFALLKGNRAVKETHMSMVGGIFGRLAIPDDRHEEWLTMYANELRANPTSLFFCERRTPVFRMFLDLDFIEAEVVDLAYLKKFSRECTRVFREFFSNLCTADIWKCVILTSPPSMKNEDVIKTGCHLLWPCMFVNQVQALQMRATLVDTLTRTWTPREPPANTYEEIVDRTVFISNGLRMMGSSKGLKCKTCKNMVRERQNCAGCQSTGYIVENRVYSVAVILSHDEEDNETLTAWRQNISLCVQMTSIRSFRDIYSAGFNLPATVVVDAEVKRLKKKVKVGCEGSVERPHEAIGLPGAVVLDKSTRLFMAIQAFIISNLNPNWNELQADALLIQHSMGRFIVHVSGPGSSYCTNVNRAHSSSHIL